MPLPKPVTHRPLLRRSSWVSFAIAGVFVYLGWRSLWHMADDAYITYRYLSNVMAGRGLVWNPAPFAPVDGNTDFLWSMLLLALWKLFGWMPPDVANNLNLLFGLGTLLLVAVWVERVRLPASVERHRPIVVALTLAAVASNRAFLASLSSGLGMAIFNANLLGWAFLATRARRDDATWRWLRLAFFAALTGLSRPEGQLAVAATCVLLLMLGWRHRLAAAAQAIATAVLPVVGLLGFRRLYYGDWLPCTYYAKSVAAWPESGVRFLASFVVEFGLYVWLAVAVAWLLHKLRAGQLLAPLQQANLGTAAVVSVCLFHCGYYTLYIGGDLFEWRVYTHLAVLLPLSLVTMIGDLSPRWTLPVLATALVVAQPIPWLKYAVDDGPVAPHLPALLRPLVEPYDAWQAWLNAHTVCMRNHHMKVNFDELAAPLPPREEGQRIPFDGFPVYAAEAVGLVGWVFPNVAIIDIHGLNDWVVAHTPVASAEQRRASQVAELGARFDYFDQDHDGRVTLEEFMPWYAALTHSVPGPEAKLQAKVALEGFDSNHDGAVTKAEYIANNEIETVRHHAHERLPPPGYVEGFHPNLQLLDHHATVLPRAQPLTAQAIREHEAHYRLMVTSKR